MIGEPAGAGDVVQALFEAARTSGGSAALDDVRVGAFWVGVRTSAGTGMASTLRSEDHLHGSRPIAAAGELQCSSPLELAGLLASGSVAEASVGLAAVNALLSSGARRLPDEPAVAVLERYGGNAHVAMIGHFPFADRLRSLCGRLDVFERGRHRGTDDRDEQAMVTLLPAADVVAVTATTLINRTIGPILKLVRDDAFLMMLGPSTPLTPALFDFGFDVLCGTVIDDADAAMRAIGQGAVTSQIPGVRRVALWQHDGTKGGKGEAEKGGGDLREKPATTGYWDGTTGLGVAEPDAHVIVRHGQLEVYRRSFELASKLFELSAGFPDIERYSLTDQIRRSSRSVCANIAEAWRKRRYRASFQSALNVAEAEAAETQTWIAFARDCGYISSAEARGLQEGYDGVIGRLVVMINSPDKWLLGGQR